MSMHFRWKHGHPPVGTIDASVLRPDLLAALTVQELKQKHIRIGRVEYPWKDVFEIEGTPGESWILPGSVNYMHCGGGLTRGQLTIDGHAGDYAGLKMQGGRLEVRGDAGSSLGAGMQGGMISVAGNAGPQVGGPAPDEMHGMTDGEILIAGSAGPRAGFKMRRGLIAVQHATEHAGYHMNAGTLVILNGPLVAPGLSMKRGTILCLDPHAPCTWLPYFQSDIVYSPVFVKILLGHVNRLGWPVPDHARQGRFQLYSGDRLNSGKGEILQLLTNS